MIFKLHDFYENPLTKLVIKTSKNGGTTNALYEFEPGEEYETKDPILQGFIKGEIGDVTEKPVMTQDLKDMLDFAKIPYAKKKCSSCPNAKPHLWFNPFKIVLEDEEEEER